MKTKSNLQTTIFNYKTPEFYINMNQNSIPPKGSDLRKDFIKEEKRKCREGINVNGIYIPGSLYFHLNYYKLEGDSKTQKGKKEVFLPSLRDNEWIVFNDYEEALKQGKAYTLFGLRQCGKELADYEEIITKDGLKQIKDIKVGDIVYGKDGKETNVIGVFPQGIKPIYRMTLLDGRTIDCGLEHQWEVFKKNRTKKILTTKQIIDLGVKRKHSRAGFNYNFYIDENQPTEFPKKQLPINPYILGALIGDGGCTMGTNTMNSIDREIIERFEKELPEYDIKPEEYTYKGVTQACKHTIVYKRGKKLYLNKNPLNQELIKLGLKVKSYQKFIPEEYKWSSVEDRYEIIRGLFDTDGCILKNGSIEFKTSAKQLAEDVMWVLRSLGIKCQLGITDVRGIVMNLPNNKTYLCDKLYYRVYVNTDKPVFFLKRKLDRLKVKKTTNRVGIASIEYIGEYSATCISVDNKDHLYLTKDSIPTHNTEMETSLCLRELSLFKRTEALALFAGDNFKQNFTKKLRIAIEHGEKFIIVPNIDKDWKKEEIRFGITKADNTLDLHSTLFIYNTQEGKKIQVSSGKTPSFFLIDEAAVSPFREVYETVKPSLLSDYGGFRCSPVFTLTGGEALKSKDAELFIKYPVAEEQLIFTHDGKDYGGRFLDGRYRKDCKKDTTISDYIGIKTNTWLDNYPIRVSDFKLAEERITKEREEASKSPDKKALHLKKIFFPMTIDDVFLSENENPFPTEAIEQQIQFLNSNPFGQNIELFRNVSGKVQFKFSNKLPIYEYPTKSTNLDAPIVMYDSPEKFKGQKGLHIIGADTIAEDETTQSDSLGSIYVIRKNHSDLSDPFNGCIVASYTGRPKTVREFNELVLMLSEFYDAQIMYEHVNSGFKDYFEGKNKFHLLIQTPSLQKEINPNSAVKASTGLKPTPNNKKHALNLVLDYCNEELADGKIGVSRIPDPVLLQELLAYDGTKNVDRYIAFSMGIEALYMFKKYTTIVNYETEEQVQEVRQRKNAFGFDVNKKTNSFGFKF